MKKTIFVFLLALFCTLPIGSNSTIQASSELKVPKLISIGDEESYDAGKIVVMQLMEGEKIVGNKTRVDYGIARVIKNSMFETYEIVTSESIEIDTLTTHPVISLTIPNPQSARDSSNTYVAYIQYSEKNNETNLSYYNTKEFKITPNNTPFLQVKNVNLLSSNGKRFFTKEGPSIYSPEAAKEIPGTATSTSIEITIESNQDTKLNPSITFTKIRSNTFSKVIALDSLSVKSGETYSVIPLPTFDYSPGVYMGTLSFGNNAIKKQVEFQYIVSGASVSIGSVVPEISATSSIFIYEIFGTPLDFERFSATSSESLAPTEIYNVTTKYIDSSGKILLNTIQEVDFAKQSFSTLIPKKFREIDKVDISIVSPATGEIVFETSRTVSYVNPDAFNVYIILYVILFVLLILITVFAIYKSYIKTAIVCIIILIGLFFVRSAFAVRIDFEPFRDLRAGNSKAMSFTEHGHSQLPALFADDEVLEPTQCGEPTQIKFSVFFIRCTNNTPGVKVGFSRTSYADALARSQVLGLGNGTEKVTVGTVRFNQVDHVFYRDMSSQATATIAPVPEKDSILYATVDAEPVVGGIAMTEAGFTRYQIPLKNTCGENPPTCSCAGRTEICSVSGMDTVTTPNSPACALQASCSISRTGTMATFNTIVTNAIGAVTYKNADTGETISNPIQREVAVGASIVQRILVTDTDGMTATATCTATNDGSVVDVGTTTTATSTRRVPTITKFAPVQKVVPKNRNCSYGWEVKDVDVCTLEVNNNSILLTGNGLTGGPVDVSAADGNNQRATLKCVANDLPEDKKTIATTTLCQVIPEVIER